MYLQRIAKSSSALLRGTIFCGTVFLSHVTPLSQASVNTVVFTYSYDGGSRLTMVHSSSGDKVNYAYDAAGNQTSVASTFIPTSIGDYNRDGLIDLKDVILSLQSTSGYQIKGLDLGADANTDGKIGIADTIYVLRSVGN